MSWLKLLLGLITVCFCTALGYFAAGKYRSRKKFFNHLNNFHERYLNELTYSRKPIGEFLSQYDYTGEFEKSVKAFSVGRTLQFSYPFLKKDETAYLENYFGMLGRGDVRSQAQFFEAQSGNIKQKREESEKEAKMRGELYLKLGLLAGLAFVILII